MGQELRKKNCWAKFHFGGLSKIFFRSSLK